MARYRLVAAMITAGISIGLSVWPAVGCEDQVRYSAERQADQGGGAMFQLMSIRMVSPPSDLPPDSTAPIVPHHEMINQFGGS